MTQESLFDIAERPKKNLAAGSLISAASAKKNFGCCSRCRECSETGKCLVPDAEYSANCIYRLNLESGKIFYGTKADGFNESDYKAYLSEVQTLDTDERESLDGILWELCYWQRGVAFICVRRSALIDKLANCGLLEQNSALEYLQDVIGPRRFENYVWNDHAKYSEWKKFKKTVKLQLNGEKFDTAMHLYPWMAKHCAEIFEQLDTDYCIVSIPKALGQYAEEFFQNQLLCSECPRYESVSLDTSVLQSDPVWKRKDLLEKESDLIGGGKDDS